MRRVQRFRLFLGIVWRVWEDEYGRISVRTAWHVSGIVWGPPR
jgi:hypothetical protein